MSTKITDWPPPVSRGEYESRLRRLQERSRERELDGLVVWSKGGHPDTYADVFFLTGYCPRFNRSQAALVLPTDGEPILIVDVLDVRRDLIEVDEVVFDVDVAAAAANAAMGRGLSGGNVGLVGGVGLTANLERALIAGIPGLAATDEDIVSALRAVKSPAELELVRAAFAVGNDVVDTIMRAALEGGRTEAEAVTAGYALGIPQGMLPIDSMVGSGPASHFYAYGQLPRWTIDRVLQPGDMFHVDHAGVVHGYVYDFARSGVVGGRPTQAQREVLEGAIEVVEAGVAAVRPGLSGKDLYAVMSGALRERGLTTDQEPIMGHGHGLGVGIEPPFVLPFEEREIRAGMVLAVETMAGASDVGSVYFEHNVIVTEDGADVLTTCPSVYW